MAVRYERILVTPELAQYYLDRNCVNRRLERGTIDAYLRDIENGNGVWRETGQNNICISESGMLKDGQHRLSAVLKYGKPVEMTFAFGVSDDETQYDRGRSRSISDTLRMARYDASLANNSVVATISLYVILRLRSRAKVTAEDVRAVLDEHEDEIRDVCGLFFTRRNNVNVRRSFIMLAALIAHKNGVSLETLKRFAEIASTGLYDNPKETSAIVFRNDLIAKKYPSNTNQAKSLASAEKAIFDFSRGVERKITYSGTKDFVWDIEI